MPKGHPGVKRPRDPAQLAKLMIDIASGDPPMRSPQLRRSGKRRNHPRLLKATSAPATKPRPSPPGRPWPTPQTGLFLLRPMAGFYSAVDTLPRIALNTRLVNPANSRENRIPTPSSNLITAAQMPEIANTLRHSFATHLLEQDIDIRVMFFWGTRSSIRTRSTCASPPTPSGTS